jgi:phospholipid/cholesterol/gamma-HCH transport system substrate-binding protein
METKANTALIGAFTLIVFALAFVFIYWLARGGQESNSLPLIVVFNDPVTGLATGSQVVFNGIKVGEVKRLSLDPERPSTVVAELSVQTNTPIKSDTNVVLGFQGLTGVGFVDMSGGSPDAPDIWKTETPAVLVASRSSMQDLMAGARSILGRADNTLKTIEDLVTKNSDQVNASIENVKTFTGALAANSDGIKNLMEQASKAAAAISQLTPKLQSIADRSDALVASINPEQVRATVDEASRIVKGLADRTAELQGIIDRANSISASVDTFAQGLPGMREQADALLAAVDPAKVGRTLTKIDQVAGAIDPKRVQTTVNGLADLGETMSANKENIDHFVTRLSAISSDVSGFSARLPDLGTRVDALLGSIDPAKVADTIDSADKFAKTLSDNRADVDQILANVRSASERVSSLSEKAEALLTKLNNMAGGGTGDLLTEAQATMQAIRVAAQTFTAQTAAIGPGIGRFSNGGLRDIQSLVGQSQRTVDRLDRVLGTIERNPSSLVFGGEKVPEISGGARH